MQKNNLLPYIGTGGRVSINKGEKKKSFREVANIWRCTGPGTGQLNNRMSKTGDKKR